MTLYTFCNFSKQIHVRRGKKEEVSTNFILGILISLGVKTKSQVQIYTVVYLLILKIVFKSVTVAVSI